jgi:hypothetical protein
MDSGLNSQAEYKAAYYLLPALFPAAPQGLYSCAQRKNVKLISNRSGADKQTNLWHGRF